jgi:ferredoxin
MELNAMSMHLRIDPILCDGYGQCAELVPELIELDDWGYPIVADVPVSRELGGVAQLAVAMCPRRAVALDRRRVVEGTLR